MFNLLAPGILKFREGYRGLFKTALMECEGSHELKSRLYKIDTKIHEVCEKPHCVADKCFGSVRAQRKSKQSLIQLAPGAWKSLKVKMCRRPVLWTREGGMRLNLA